MIYRDLNTASDEQLFILIKGGDEAAFDIVFKRYWRKLFIFVMKAIGDEDEAEDILQEVFVSLWRRRDLIEIETTLSAYLFASARFGGLNFIRKQISRRNYSCYSKSLFSEEDNSFQENFDAKELRTVLHTEAAKLPSRMGEIFLLSRDQELSHKEIARELNISDKTVKKQISNALKLFSLKFF